MQHMASTDSETIDGGDYWFRERTDLLLYVQYIETGNTIFADIATTSLDVHVTSCTKGGVSCTGQDNDIDIRSFTADVKRIAHLGGGGRGEGVTIPLSIDRDPGDALVEIE